MLKNKSSALQFLKDLGLNVRSKREISPNDRYGAIIQAHPNGLSENQLITLYGQNPKQDEDIVNYTVDGTEVSGISTQGKVQTILSEREIDQLLAASTKISSTGLGPMEIEFVFCGTELFFLEAEPQNKSRKLPNDAKTSNMIIGIPCSQGKAQAECIVIHQNTAKSEAKDKIIIINRSEDLLNYLSAGIAGIIIENGNLLSHASVIARELGVPCLIKVQDATKRFKTGMMLTIDGESGRIGIIGEENWPLPREH